MIKIRAMLLALMLAVTVVLIVGSAPAQQQGDLAKTVREIAGQLQKAEKEKKEAKPEERVEDYLTVDPMEVELGVGLIRLADPNRGLSTRPRRRTDGGRRARDAAPIRGFINKLSGVLGLF